MKTNDIRAAFLGYFQQHQHAIVPSSSLVPNNDPTLLFTNAGMVQFKDVFLGVESRPYTRATSSQRCVRAGGKHNDLENVGHTARHHTFFEMLGNFSFGDYFKREAIQFAWSFLTEVMKLPAEKLWVTVYHDDKDSEAIWFDEVAIDQSRFSRCGEKDNFWSMGETGPCGPCTEIFYDHGADVPGGPPGSPDEDADRYIEIWNLVFMQYNRDASGKLHPLPNPCVDTGMGLERIAAVMQGVHNNYDIDLFQSLLQALSAIIHYKDITHASMRVIVDHIRSTSFMIADGVTPSNEGRGYVLRRIIRRALRHGYQLGMSEPFFYKLVPALCEQMGQAFPELNDHQDQIERVLEQEEKQFLRTLANGVKLYKEVVSALPANTKIPGDTVFKLYDTYGFPPDLTADMAREQGLEIDMPGFDQAMAKQRAQSQKHQSFKVDQSIHMHLSHETEFVGYESLSEEAQVETLLCDQQPVQQVSAGDDVIVVLNRTPFYAESGGQVGDSGFITKAGATLRIQDTQKKGQTVIHWGQVIEGQFSVGDTVRAEVDSLRDDIRRNHSATHMLHEALRQVLGEHVTQKGSLVDAQRLRFDFSHAKALTPDELKQIEALVNQEIRANHLVSSKEQSLEEAKAAGAMALFGEKYADDVRVVSMGAFSTEICGGTHVDRTGDIGVFKILNETACSAGVRRIEAMTGERAFNWLSKGYDELNKLAQSFKTQPTQVAEKIEQLQQQLKSQQKDIDQLKAQMVSGQSQSLADDMQEISGIQVLAKQLSGADRDTLRQSIDQLKSEFSTLAVVLATVKDDKVILIAGVTKPALNMVKAPDILKHVTAKIDGKGGGRPDLAQGGGNDVAALPAALESVYEFVRSKVTG